MTECCSEPIARDGCPSILVCCLVAVGWLILTPVAVVAAEYTPGTPFTYLFDTNSSSPEPLSPHVLAAKTGWTVLAEDDVKHKFKGDAVMLNDKLAVVVRSKASGAEVYSQTPVGLKLRARLAPLPASGDAAKAAASLAVRENTPASVALAAVFQTAAGGRQALSYGITTGQRIVEVRPGEGSGRLFVSASISYVVVPDLFADDMVFGPEAFHHSRLELPTENMVLNLLQGSDAMLMCLWRSSRQGATAVLSEGAGKPGPRVIDGCEVQCAKDASLWVALMEGPGIWRQQPLPAAGTQKETTLNWKPPFSARWRADFIRRDGAARSWDVLGPGPTDEASPALAQPDCPCRFEGNQAKLSGDRHAGPLLIYPLDRTRATPLTAFCPVDMLRNTLGVGPCQYILQTEGLATETNPTPDQVMSFVEKQFEKKKEKKAAEQIRDLLKQMVEQVGQTQVRIEQYAEFARQIRGLCAAEVHRGNTPPLPLGEGRGEGAVQGGRRNTSNALQIIDGIAGEMEEVIAARGAGDPKHQAGNLADEVAGLIGKENPLAECQRLGAELRRIGAVQDRSLSKCRMSVRWLKQQAAMIAPHDPAATDRATEVQRRAEKLLQNP